MTNSFLREYRSFRQEQGAADETVNIELRIIQAMFFSGEKRKYSFYKKYRRDPKFLSPALSIVFLTGFWSSLFLGFFPQKLDDGIFERRDSVSVAARQTTKNNITREQVNLFSNSKTIDEYNRIRQAWEKTFGVDIWYPYFTAKEVEDKIKKKLRVKIFKLKGEAQIERNLFIYAFKTTF